MGKGLEILIIFLQSEEPRLRRFFIDVLLRIAVWLRKKHNQQFNSDFEAVGHP